MNVMHSLGARSGDCAVDALYACLYVLYKTMWLDCPYICVAYVCHTIRHLLGARNRDRVAV
jgi:hypothetical protein